MVGVRSNLPASVVNIYENCDNEGCHGQAHHDRNSISSKSLCFHKLTDNGTLRSQRAHTSGHNAEIADDCRHDRVHTCGYRNRDRDDRNDRERRDGSRSHRTDQESEQVHDERDQRLVRSDKRYHFFCEKLQSSVFVDDGKQICDADHLHTEGGTESLDDVSGLDPVDETEDHGEADT